MQHDSRRSQNTESWNSPAAWRPSPPIGRSDSDRTQRFGSCKVARADPIMESGNEEADSDHPLPPGGVRRWQRPDQGLPTGPHCPQYGLQQRLHDCICGYSWRHRRITHPSFRSLHTRSG